MNRLALILFVVGSSVVEAHAAKPNIIFILADDLGYGDLGCYGQKVIQTPSLDRLAREGMRFTQMYAGATVCAPSRCVLMTGKHLGHARVRGNTAVKEHQSLQPGDVTVAEVLKEAGYATGLVGKWGIGELGTQGIPNKQGFDYFYGYLNQHHAHNYYPAYLFRNEEKVTLRNVVPPADDRNASRHDEFGVGWATTKLDYSHDLLAAEGLRFIERNKDRPFFLYLAFTIPHANNEANRAHGNGQEVPDFGIYADRDWPDSDKGQAAMISRMDRDVGRLLDLLKTLSIDRDTIVLFSSDNGPHREGGQDVDRFDPNGPLRGMKRDLFEGGIRVPFLAWRPGSVPAGSVSDHIGYFGDFLATAAELAGAETPAGLDSISLVSTLAGKPDGQRKHDYLYWEFYERGGSQAVRQENWKAVRIPIHTGKTQLFQLVDDIGEQHDISDRHPDIARRLEGIMAAAHSPDPRWKASGDATPKSKSRNVGKQGSSPIMP